MEATMQQLHQLANERLSLYRLASKQRLTPAQQDRIQAINAQLPVLWDQYRREYAANTWRTRQPKPMPTAIWADESAA